jgi:predicted ATPase
VWLVELAALSDPLLVPQTVARALEVKEQPGKSVSESVSGWLASKNLLLVLDNAEHLLEGCARLVDHILSRNNHVTVLAASRERLGMTGELTYRVPSLTVPGTDESRSPEIVSSYEGVRLFIERAALLRRGFHVTSENAAAVASICGRLDGMPLAIELAAPRLSAMSVDELSERLDQRFALLTDGSRAALPRHRTLRSMLDWSYDLLSKREQAMLRRVAVFAGGWTLKSAEQVCGGDRIDPSDVIDQLTSLVDKNLVLTDEQDGATRYRMLETVRQYAQDRLRESGEEVLRRGSHLACFGTLAKDFCDAREGPHQQSWLRQVASEHDNLRAALAWSIESNPIEGLPIAANLDVFWRVSGHFTEGREWLSRLLEVYPVDGSPQTRASALYGAALLAIFQGDYASAKDLLQKSLALHRQIGDLARAARVLSALAWLSIQKGEYPEAEAPARESANYARTTGDSRLLLASLGNLAIALHRQGQWAAARELLEEALAVARGLGTPWEIGNALHEIGRVECDEKHYDVAKEHFVEAITILHGLGNLPGTIDALQGLAGVAAATAESRRAARLWGAADALREQIGNPMSVDESIAYERLVKPVRAVLTTQAFDQAWQEGQAMNLDEAVRYALDGTAERDD